MQSKRRWLPGWQRIELAEKVELEGWSCRQAAAWRHVAVSTVITGSPPAGSER